MPRFAEPVPAAPLKKSGAPAAGGGVRAASAPRPPLAQALQLRAAASARAGRSGLPERLKAGVEALSGLAMDDVRVHRNSAEPAKLGALAYAQGRDIHLGPGQEQHLPHEAWHVVQQKQGRVQPTVQAKGALINDDRGLESEADAMGDRALRIGSDGADQPRKPASSPSPSPPVVQRIIVGKDGKAINPKFLEDSIRALRRKALQAYVRSMHERQNVITTFGAAARMGTASLPPPTWKIERGLVRGTYRHDPNDADLHVQSKAGGAGLSAADMLWVAEQLLHRMKERTSQSGPDGTINLHPTGAAIVKTVVELLSGALGGRYSQMRAAVAKATRGSLAGAQPDKLHANILPEHFHHLESLRGGGVRIVPRFQSAAYMLGPNAPEAAQIADLSQDMMTEDQAGTAKFVQYQAYAQDPKVATSASLDITIQASQLPAIIAVLKERAIKMVAKK